MEKQSAGNKTCDDKNNDMDRVNILRNRKGQAGIMDGLLLLIITSICSIALLGISGSYGKEALLHYDVIYKQKVVQSALLSLYHITENDRSIMAYVSQDIAGGDFDLTGSKGRIGNILGYYGDKIGWDFGFALLDKQTNAPMESTYITNGALNFDQFVSYPKVCANAALTYPVEDSMDYQLFQVCVWSID